MISVLFICHGNICRSPMAEFLFKDYLKKKNKLDLFYIDSKATSTEEIGNRVHSGTRKVLDKYNIDYSNKRASQITKADYEKFDFIIAMDEYNIYNLLRILGNDNKKKIHLLLSYAGINRDISDPWYTGNFIQTEKDILLGIDAFYKYLVANKFI